MSMETDVILRSVLYQVMIAKDLKEAERAIAVMCSKDLVAAVKEEAAKHKAEQNK